MDAAKSQSHFTVTRRRPMGSQSKALRRFSPAAPLMVAAAAMTPSRLPYSAIHLAAVLGPTFSTPGTLSTASPMRVR